MKDLKFDRDVLPFFLERDLVEEEVVLLSAGLYMEEMLCMERSKRPVKQLRSAPSW